MPTFTTANIRNTVLLSHSGAGKTMLAEAILFSANMLSRLGSIEEGTTTSDYEPEEIRRQPCNFGKWYKKEKSLVLYS